METLKTFDFYPKLSDEVRVKTFSGAAISVIATLVMAILFLSQFFTFMTTEVVDRLVVDTTRGEPLRLNFDITFAKLPCDVVSIDIMDVAGRHVNDIQHSFHKQSVFADGTKGKRQSYALGNDLPLFGPGSRVTDVTPLQPRCGSCYGAENHEDDCCSTCDDVRQRHKTKGRVMPPLSSIPVCASEYLQELKDKVFSGEGCRIYGHYSVQKVAGQLRIIPGRNEEVARNLARLFKENPSSEDVIFSQIDVSHRIDSFAFGDTWPGIVSPLEGTEKVRASDAPLMYLYYAKVVPTSLTTLDGKVMHSNQYSVTEHVKSLEIEGLSASSPGIYLAFELSPIRVSKVEQRQPFLSFLTQVCAIVGGVFAVAGFVDRLVYASVRHVAAKIEIGKDDPVSPSIQILEPTQRSL